MKFIKTDNPNFGRDLDSKAVVSTDANSLKAYRKQRDLKQTQEARISRVEDELTTIKALLLQIMSKLDGPRNTS